MKELVLENIRFNKEKLLENISHNKAQPAVRGFLTRGEKKPLVEFLRDKGFSLNSCDFCGEPVDCETFPGSNQNKIAVRSLKWETCESLVHRYFTLSN